MSTLIITFLLPTKQTKEQRTGEGTKNKGEEEGTKGGKNKGTEEEKNRFSFPLFFFKKRTNKKREYSIVL
jgi:hypothetical protein